MQMATKQNRRSDQEWVTLIRECRASGLSDKDWCAHHAIQVRTFYKQVARPRKKGFDIPKTRRTSVSVPQDVVPLEIAEEASRTGSTGYTDSSVRHPDLFPAVILSIRDYRIEITNHAEQSTISSILSALQQLC